MTIAEVVGPVKVVLGIPGAAELRWVRVRREGTETVALDPVGAAAGQQVLLTAGAGAGHISPEVPVDLAVVGILAQG